MPNPYVTQAHLEARFGARMVKQYFADDGGSAPGPRLAFACIEASRKADAILAKAWPSEEARKLLVENDEGVRGPICVLVMHIGTGARPEWFKDGVGPFSTQAKEALQTLEQIAQAELRPASEAQAGKNPTYSDRLVAPDPNFIFTPSGGKSNLGGF